MKIHLCKFSVVSFHTFVLNVNKLIFAYSKASEVMTYKYEICIKIFITAFCHYHFIGFASGRDAVSMLPKWHPNANEPSTCCCPRRKVDAVFSCLYSFFDKLVRKGVGKVTFLFHFTPDSDSPVSDPVHVCLWLDLVRIFHGHVCLPSL